MFRMRFPALAYGDAPPPPHTKGSLNGTDTIIVFFFAVNKNKDNAKVTSASSNALPENSEVNLTRNNIFCRKKHNFFLSGDFRRTANELPDSATHFLTPN